MRRSAVWRLGICGAAGICAAYV
eukprot:COSAG01_NODE_47225_length_392_cov_1.409556_1_plen_22_part_01